MVLTRTWHTKVKCQAGCLWSKKKIRHDPVSIVTRQLNDRKQIILLIYREEIITDAVYYTGMIFCVL